MFQLAKYKKYKKYDYEAMLKIIKTQTNDELNVLQLQNRLICLDKYQARDFEKWSIELMAEMEATNYQCPEYEETKTNTTVQVRWSPKEIEISHNVINNSDPSESDIDIILSIQEALEEEEFNRTRLSIYAKFFRHTK